MNIGKFSRTAFFIEHFRWLFLPFTTTFRNYYWKDRLITVNKGHVNSTLEKHLKKVLGTLQVVNKEMQSLLLTFRVLGFLGFFCWLWVFVCWVRYFKDLKNISGCSNTYSMSAMETLEDNQKIIRPNRRLPKRKHV